VAGPAIVSVGGDLSGIMSVVLLVNSKAISMNAPPIPPGSGSSPVRDLAARIYVELVGRVMLTKDQAKPNPVDLAKYCYKLAEAFQSVEIDAQKDAVAKMAKYDVKVDDITNWKK
jgi:hypothetical protein